MLHKWINHVCWCGKCDAFSYFPLSLFLALLISFPKSHLLLSKSSLCIVIIIVTTMIIFWENISELDISTFSGFIPVGRYPEKTESLKYHRKFDNQWKSCLIKRIRTRYFLLMEFTLNTISAMYAKTDTAAHVARAQSIYQYHSNSN